MDSIPDENSSPVGDIIKNLIDADRVERLAPAKKVAEVPQVIGAIGAPGSIIAAIPKRQNSISGDGDGSGGGTRTILTLSLNGVPQDYDTDAFPV